MSLLVQFSVVHDDVAGNEVHHFARSEQDKVAAAAVVTESVAVKTCRLMSDYAET